MPKIVDKEKMREEILEASLKAFSQHGFHSTTMNLIAKEAGVAKGTLYLYFHSKESLTDAIIQKYISHLQTKLQDAKSPQTLENFLSLIRSLLILSEDEELFIPLFFEIFSVNVTSDAATQYYKEFFDTLSMLFLENLQRLQKSAFIDDALHPEILAKVCLSMIDGLLMHKSFLKLDEKEYLSIVDEMMYLLQKALEKKEEK